MYLYSFCSQVLQVEEVLLDIASCVHEVFRLRDINMIEHIDQEDEIDKIIPLG